MNVRLRLEDLRDRLGLGKERSFALNELDVKLSRHVTRHGGVFVEAGANNGLAFSNTLFFERFRGWRGLLIEPMPELYERCRRNRPRCKVEQCALVAPDFTEREIGMSFCHLMSLVDGAMGSPEADAEHLRRGEEVQGVRRYSARVPALTLSAVLRKNGIRRFDLLSLDVEGYELPALQGLDLDEFQPEWLLIEVRDRSVIDSYLAPRYQPEAELSHHDVLYRRACHGG